MDDLSDRQNAIDERWLGEWFEFGFAELSTYLRRCAQFDDWCRENGQLD